MKIWNGQRKRFRKQNGVGSESCRCCMRHIANVTLASLAYMVEVASLTSFLFLSLTVLSLSQFFFFSPNLTFFLFSFSQAHLTFSLSTFFAFGCLNLTLFSLNSLCLWLSKSCWWWIRFLSHFSISVWRSCGGGTVFGFGWHGYQQFWCLLGGWCFLSHLSISAWRSCGGGTGFGFADMGINNFDVCLVVDGNFVVDLGA